jgi:NAD-dependent dihydropyrimidine dehydrogenase PreA subunit
LHPDNLANAEDVINICPTDVFTHNEEGKIAVRDELACTLCMACAEKATPVDSKKSFPVKIEGDETSFIFYVESTGALPPRRIVSEAAKVLEKKATSLNDLVKKGFE